MLAELSFIFQYSIFGHAFLSPLVLSFHNFFLLTSCAPGLRFLLLMIFRLLMKINMICKPNYMYFFFPI
jgi:hypothetical protein